MSESDMDSAQPVASEATTTLHGETQPPSAPPAVTPPEKKGGGLALGALIVGIVAMVCAVIPGLSFVAFLPAIAAAVLGVVALASKRPGRGKALAGVILGPIALLVAIIVSVSTIVGGVGDALAPVASDDPVPSVDTADAEPAEDEVQEEAPEEIPEPVVPESVVYEGVGDSILEVVLPDGAGQLAAATVTHVGSGHFSIWSLDAAMEQQELLVNVIGSYNGTVLYNNGRGGDITSFEISADGPWTVTVKSLLSLREFEAGSASGTGDDVVIYRGDAGAAAITHDGQGHVAVWTYGASSNLVVNTIGTYSGTARWTAGPSVVEISADGNWSIDVG